MASTTFSGPLTVTNGPLTVGGVVVTAVEVGYVDGLTPGTVTASKAVVVDSNKDASAFRNVGVVNIDAGASGTAGSVDVFPTTASKGKVSITAADSAGDTTTAIVNASQSGARTYTIPDAGASASFLMSAASQTAISSTQAEIDLICDQSGYSETLTASGANTSALTKRVHALDTTLGAQTCTPAAPGAANYGVINVWCMTVRGGTNDSVFTLTNFRGGSQSSTATFDSVGETLTAIGGPDNKWHIIGEDGVTLA